MAKAQDQFIGEIRLFAGSFPPADWAFCNGQLLPISQNTALFSLLGTNYGGDGKSTFALPNLQGKFAIGAGQGHDLAPISLGEDRGSATVTLTVANLPAHNHSFNVGTANNGNNTNGANAVINTTAKDLDNFNIKKPYTTVTGNTSNVAATAIAGASVPVAIINPYLTLNYIIALKGIFPSRP